MSEHAPEQAQNPLEIELTEQEEKFMDNLSETKSHLESIGGFNKSVSEGVGIRVKAIRDFIMSDDSGVYAALTGVLSVPFIMKMTEHIANGNPEGIVTGLMALGVVIEGIKVHMSNKSKGL